MSTSQDLIILNYVRTNIGWESSQKLNMIIFVVKTERKEQELTVLLLQYYVRAVT